MGKRIITVVLTLLFVLSIPLSYSGEGEYISSPSNVNKILSDFSDIDMKPGENQRFKFEFYNPYNSSIKNASLDIQIYNFRDYNKNDDIEEMDNSIYFESSGETKVVYEIDQLASKERKSISFIVDSKEETNKGVYSVRFSLNFYMEDDGKISMKSIGYFSNQELEKASKKVGDNDDEHFVGGYNLTELEVDGILKETSIAVKEPKTRWPQYILGASTVILSALAVYYYLKERKD